jgi:hypothetical protein
MSRPRRTPNRDHARRTRSPDLASPAVEQHLTDLIAPATYAQMSSYRALGLRARLLTLPVMVALVLIMIWRHVASATDLVRLLAREQLLWLAPLAQPPTQQALSARLRTFPAALFEQVLWDVVGPMHQRFAARTRPLPPAVERAQAHFAAVQVLDASTLEVLFRKVGLLREAATPPLAGTLAAVIDLPSRLPTALWYDAAPQANEKRFSERFLATVGPQSLSIFDLGFFAFPFFDQFTERQAFFLTRLRDKTAYTVEQVLESSPHLRDRLVRLGVYRANPCVHPLRLIEVWHQGHWYTYLTNVLDPARLSALDAADLYRRRWRIEEAFLIVKRLLDLAYLWVGAINGILLQVWATWLLYAVLLDLCDAVADHLHLPLDRISVEMTFRGLYHFTVAYSQGKATDPVRYLADPANADLGIVKRLRQPRGQPPPPRPAPVALDTMLQHLNL